MKKYTKNEAISIVVQCAEQYHQELEQKNLLFVCVDKRKQTQVIELSFYGNNYMHLTGLKPCRGTDGRSGLSANDFYQKCLNHKLSPTDFEFSEDGTTHRKLAVLPSVICKNLHANLIGDYNSARLCLCTEKIVGNVHACMGFTFDRKICEYVPNTVLQEDARNLTSTWMRVLAGYRKDASVERYVELTYQAKNVDWSSILLPEQFAYLSPVQSAEHSDEIEYLSI